jgi:hypothetical protein
MTEKFKIDFVYKPQYFDTEGNKLVGVTTAINKLAKPQLTRWAYNLGLENINMDEYLKHTQRLGTIIHARIMAYENNLEIDKSNVTPEEWKISNRGFNSYKKWYLNTIIEPIFYEKSFVSLIYRYGGKPDKFGIRNGIPIIIDYKTGKDIYSDNFVQLSAYVNLLIENKFKPLPKRVLAVNIPRFKGDSFATKEMGIDELFENGYWDKYLAGLGAYYADLKISNSKKDSSSFNNKNEKFYQYVKEASSV